MNFDSENRGQLPVYVQTKVRFNNLYPNQTKVMNIRLQQNRIETYDGIVVSPHNSLSTNTTFYKETTPETSYDFDTDRDSYLFRYQFKLDPEY
jgi:cytolysin (calcineurin-like family phosphatase)